MNLLLPLIFVLTKVLNGLLDPLIKLICLSKGNPKKMALFPGGRVVVVVPVAGGYPPPLLGGNVGYPPGKVLAVGTGGYLGAKLVLYVCSGKNARRVRTILSLG